MSTPVPTTIPPTTLAGTTAVPTTTLTTPAPTTPPPHVADNDVVFNCWANNYEGVPIIYISISGIKLESTHVMATTDLSINVSISGSVPTAALVTDSTMSMEVSIDAWAMANAEKKNWVAWSKIGDVSMVLDRVNDAGRRPMQWQGYLYQVKKINKNVAIYGSGGVTLAFPVKSPAPTFGFMEILPIGVKNKTSIGGDDTIHFFIDVQGCLYAFATSEDMYGVKPNLQRLGYEEFLNPLTNPVLLWDADKRRLYISDANEGYVYAEQTLTGGYLGLTGLYRMKTDLTLVGPDDVIALPVEIWTDILDFEHSGLKSIESIQFDAISGLPMQGAIAYRYNNNEDFQFTEWNPINLQGILHRRCAGTEFKIGIRTQDQGTFDLTYIKINYKYIDQRFTRDPKQPLKEY